MPHTDTEIFLRRALLSMEHHDGGTENSVLRHDIANYLLVLDLTREAAVASGKRCSKRFRSEACPFEHASGEVFGMGQRGSCDHGYLTPNGCLAHGMERYFYVASEDITSEPAHPAPPPLPPNPIYPPSGGA